MEVRVKEEFKVQPFLTKISPKSSPRDACPDSKSDRYAVLGEVQRLINMISESSDRVRKELEYSSKLVYSDYARETVKQQKNTVLSFMPPYFKGFGNRSYPLSAVGYYRHDSMLHPTVHQVNKRWTTSEVSRLYDAVNDEICLSRVSSSLEKKLDLEQRVRCSGQDIARSVIRDWVNEIESLNTYITYVQSQVDQPMNGVLAGNMSWMKIIKVSGLSNRSPSEVRVKWTNMYSPHIKWGPWDEKELEALHTVKQHSGITWKEVADLMGCGRTAFDAFRKYNNEIHRFYCRRFWTSEEDETLRLSVYAFLNRGAPINWTKVAYYVESRCAKACQLRYERTLAFDHAKWSSYEDLLLAQAVIIHGTKAWHKVSNCLQFRTKEECCSRWGHLNAEDTINSWTVEEDELLLAAFLTKDWDVVARTFSSRQPHALRNRLVTLLNTRQYVYDAEFRIKRTKSAFMEFRESMSTQSVSSRSNIPPPRLVPYTPVTMPAYYAPDYAIFG